MIIGMIYGYLAIGFGIWMAMTYDETLPTNWEEVCSLFLVMIFWFPMLVSFYTEN